MRKVMPLLVLGMVPAAALRAEEEASGEAELSKTTFGEHWYGPDVSPENLQGRVTFVVFWGFN